MNRPYAGLHGHDAAYDNQHTGASLSAPTPQSPLTNVIDGLRRKVNTLESLYDRLQQKLDPIIVAVPEGPPTKDGGITGAQSAVVMELAELEYRLGILCRKVDTLITRIEV